MFDSDKSVPNRPAAKQSQEPLDSLYDPLPATEKRLQLWAQSLPEINDAENSQRDWSPEYLQKWHDAPQEHILGSIPVAVLSRAHGGYGDDLDIPAAQMESERLESQHKLALLSTNSKQIFIRVVTTWNYKRPILSPQRFAKLSTRCVYIERSKSGESSRRTHRELYH